MQQNSPIALAPGYPALQGPAAPFTREVRVDFASDAAESDRVTFQWAKPVVVVGFYASLFIYGDEELTQPGIDDLLVQLDRHDETRFTTRQADPGARNAEQAYVTLGAITEQEGRRLHNIVIDTPSPELGVQFRWEGGADYYKTTRVKLAAFWHYLDYQRSENTVP